MINEQIAITNRLILFAGRSYQEHMPDDPNTTIISYSTIDEESKLQTRIDKVPKLSNIWIILPPMLTEPADHLLKLVHAPFMMFLRTRLTKVADPIYMVGEPELKDNVYFKLLSPMFDITWVDHSNFRRGQ